MRILVCFGTRPEYIKVKSIISKIKNITTCFIGQHTTLLQNIQTDFVINISDESNNRLNNIIINILKNNHIFNNIDYVLVQGDTTTALGIAISAFNNQKKIIHLEAGLRTYSSLDPYPEEMNRQLISRIANIHLCPTLNNKQNLLNENIKEDNIFIVGNTGLDNISKDNCLYENIVLITIHRRNNIEIVKEWFTEFEKLANQYSNVRFILPLHPNPEIQTHKNIFNNVEVIDPIEHIKLIEILKKCKCVISDSGGIQEECSFLNKKIIICRENTERPEILGKHGILCPKPEELSEIFKNIIINYEINDSCPFGDGNAYKKIQNIFHELK